MSGIKPALRYGGSGGSSRKLEPDDIGGKAAILTIASARRVNFSSNPNRADYKIVLTFENMDKEYVCNATSYYTLVGKLGENEEAWVEKPAVFAPTQTTFEGKSYEKVHVATPERWDKVMAQIKKAR